MAVHRNKSVNVHQFAMVPGSDIPRSSFRMQKALKTAFSAGILVPIFCEEVLPGDTFNVKLTAFCRLATPIYPVMDNLYLETFFFYVPNRILWDNWKKFMGEQVNPGDSISFTIPQLVSTAGGYPVSSLFDYFGLPVAGQVAGGATVSHSALPLRAYNLIYNDWFRDENLIGSLTVSKTDGPDVVANYNLARRAKRKDYFTGALPFVQKGAAVSIPLGTTAPVISDGGGPTFQSAGGVTNFGLLNVTAAGPGDVYMTTAPGSTQQALWLAPHLLADLSTATAATINQLRMSFQIQKLLERDARGGTRYTEIVASHFGVRSPDARLQRPEYLGGGHTAITVNQVEQTSATTVTGSGTPLAQVAGYMTATARGHGFSQSFVEHGYVIGLANVRADLTYQQGLRRHWSRSTRYDYYFPAFAMLGEQSILNKEIYVRGDANDPLTFGYQERWAEYRYNPSEITGLFRSTAASTIDPWHLAQKFTALPTLAQTFIEDATDASLQRVLAVGAAAAGQQILMDGFYDIVAARPLPLFSVPGLVDHF